MLKNKGFSAVALVVILAVLIGGGYAVWNNQNSTPPSALPEGEETPTSPLGGGLEGVEDWKTYRNDEYGFEFKYPNDFIIISEKTDYPLPDGTIPYGVLVGNENIYEEPRISLLLNPTTSWLRIDKTYNAELLSDGSVKIISKIPRAPYDPEDVTSENPKIRELLLNIKEKHIVWYMKFNEGGNDLEPLFDQILSTFRFIK